MSTHTINTPNPSVAKLPVAIVGAGPIGLVAAAHLVARGETPIVLEAGELVASSIRQWSHVRLFSPWRYLVDPTAVELLESAGWEMPAPDELPTGGEFVNRFVEPLASLPALAPHIRLRHRVLAISRHGHDKVKSSGRADAPFELVLDVDGRTERIRARAVIDASGTWNTANPLGANGLPAIGEIENRKRIRYAIPDVAQRDRAQYVARRTLVVGSGHSAFNAVIDLAALAQQQASGTVTWAIRRTDVGLLFGGGEKDGLEARGALGTKLQRLVESGQVTLIKGFGLDRIDAVDAGLIVTSDDGRSIATDEIVATTGFRPDLAITRELRLRLDPWLEAPEALAPLIDPNVHSCGTVYPHGAVELAHPESDFYTVGMKSYGRAPTFLLLTGYEQVRSVACALTGDEQGAREVRLVLPETGVCQTDLGGGSCCDDSSSRVGAGSDCGCGASAGESGDSGCC